MTDHPVTGDPVRHRLRRSLEEALGEEPVALRVALAVADAALDALARPGASADLVSSAALRAAAPELSEAKRAVSALKERLQD